MGVSATEPARLEAAQQAAAPQTAMVHGAIAATFQSRQTQVRAFAHMLAWQC